MKGNICIIILIITTLLIGFQPMMMTMQGETIHIQCCAPNVKGHSILRSEIYQYTNDNDIAIPNPPYQDPSKPGEAVSPLNLSSTESYTIVNPKVFVGIKHKYIGDLVVAVIPPWAKNESDIIILHNREGGSNDDIYQWFDITNKPELATWIGHKPKGMWYLYVQDWAIHYTTPSNGYIDTWTLWFEGNYPPTQPVVDVIPDSPSSEDTLVAIAHATDRDGDSITYHYKWYRNGQLVPHLTGNTVPPEETATGDRWTCEVIADDGINISSPGRDTVVVGNQAPTKPGISLKPNEPKTLDDITLQFDLESHDDNGEVSYIIDWYINGEYIPVLHNTTLMPHNYTAKGDIVECIVTPVDNLGANGPSASANITVVNTPPYPPSHFYPLTTRDTRPEISWWGAWDVDFDPISYHILVKNSTGTVFEDIVEVGESLLFPKRVGYDTYTVTIYAWDSEGASEASTFYMVIAKDANNPPSMVGGIYPNRTADCHVNIYWLPATDEDGDTLEYFIQIGGYHGTGDLVPLLSVGSNLSFSPSISFDPGMYFVQVMAFDGIAYSMPREELLYIDQHFNSPPYPPEDIYVDGRKLPAVYEGSIGMVSWSESYDPDGDNISYVLAIGHRWGDNDVFGPVDVGANTSYNLNITLEEGTYYISVQATDLRTISPPTSQCLEIIPPNRAPIAPKIYGPFSTSDTKPKIYWSPAFDPDGDEFTYYLKMTDANGTMMYFTAELDMDTTTYQPDFEFTYGTYHVTLRIIDSRGAFKELDWNLDIYPDANNPPVLNGAIYPFNTQNPRPLIFWPHAFDVEGDTINYYIAIGTKPYMNDIVDWQSTGIECSFIPPIELEHRTYYVSVYPVDGVNMGMAICNSLNITSENSPPYSVPEIGPKSSHVGTVRIWWLPTIDPDSDDVFYYISVNNVFDVALVNDKVDKTYYDITFTEAGEYRITITASDGIVNSTPTIEVIQIVNMGNHPPYGPSTILPKTTSEVTPMIYWYDAYDIDNDHLTYEIALGTALGLMDILPWTSTGDIPYYTLEFELQFKGYFVYVRCNDGKDYSETVIHELRIARNANAPPHFLITTGNTISSNTSRPEIPIPQATDIDNDDLTYSVSIGTEPYATDIMPWTDIGSKDRFVPELNLTDGIYYVNVRAYDGTVYSESIYITVEVSTFSYHCDFTVSGKYTHRSKIVMEPGKDYVLEYIIENTGGINNTIGVYVVVSDPSIDYSLIYDNGTAKKDLTFTLTPSEKTTVGLHLRVETDVKAIEWANITFISLINNKILSYNISIELRATAEEGEQGTENIEKSNTLDIKILLIIISIGIIIALVIALIIKRPSDHHAEKAKNVLKPDAVIKPKIPKQGKVNIKSHKEKGNGEIEYVEAEIEYVPDQKNIKK